MNTLALPRKASKLPERPVLEAAVNALSNTTGIVANVAAGNGGFSQDAALDLYFEGRHYAYHVEVKQVQRAATLHQVQQQFASLAQPGLLVTPRMPAELAEKCRELGIQFLDAHGNAFLRLPGLLVFVKGQRSPDVEGLDELLGMPSTAASLSAARLTFVFLCSPRLLNAPYRALSHCAGVSLGAIGPVLNDLGKRGFIVNTKNHRYFLERERLINEWATTYPVRLRPKLGPRRFRAPQRDWRQAVEIGQFDAMWGGEVAGAKLTGHLKPETATIYMNPDTLHEHLGRLVVQQRLRADPNGDVEILEKFWDLPQDDAAPDVVPPLLAYADLVASMEPRNLEAATLIHERLNSAN